MKFSEFKYQVDREMDDSKQSLISSDRSKYLELILEIVNKINSSLIIDEVLELVLKNAIKFTEAERGFIVLFDNEALEFKLGCDSNGNKLDKDSFKVSMSVVDEVFDSGASKFIESAQSGITNISSQSIFNLNLQTILCSPLCIGENKIGVIYVDSKKLKKINNKEITDTFEILAGQAATAIRNAQLYEGQVKAYSALQDANKLLEEAKEEAVKSDKLKSQFLAQMSHEIRTPIHILMSYSTLIKDEVNEMLNEELVANFDAIDEAGRRIIRTTDLILNMSEVQTGTYKYEKSSFDLCDEILLSLFNAHKVSAERKRLELSFRCSTNSTIISADKYSVYQIFDNIIDNAVKFTIEGSIVIHVYSSEDGNIIVSVKDTGVGIANEYIPRLFKPFSQEEQGYNRRFEGNGLGLALVKKYCDMNNIFIEIKSQKNVGTELLLKICNLSLSK